MADINQSTSLVTPEAQQSYDKAFDVTGAAENNFGEVQSLLNAQSPTPLGTPVNPPIDYTLQNVGAIEPNQLADATAAQANGAPLAPAAAQANQYPATNFDANGAAQIVPAPTAPAQVTSVADKLNATQNVPQAPVSDPMEGKVAAAFNAQQQSNNAVAKAVEAKAVADQAQFASAEKAYVKAEEERQKVKMQFDSDYNAKINNYEASVADYKQAAGDKIIPGKLVANMDTPQKLQTGLFMALSAYGSALSGQENQAMKVINNAINQDIDAQRFNIENKLKGARMGIEANQYLLVQMKDKFKDDESAILASRAAMLQMTQQQLNINASKLDQATAGPKAVALNSQLEMQKQQVLAQLKQQQAQQFMLQQISGGDGSRNLTPVQVAALPKELKETYVQGYGFGTAGAPGAQEFQKVRASTEPAISAAKRVLDLTQNFNRVTDMEKAAKISSEMKALAGALRVPFTGPGALTESEYNRLMDTLGDPTGLANIPKLQRARLKTVLNKLQLDLNNSATQYGYKPKDQVDVSSLYTDK